jgi:hypothetical protein
MESNVGKYERIARVGLGVLAAMAAFRSRSGWRWPLAAISTSGIITGLTQYCPINQALGIDNSTGEELIHFKEGLDESGFRHRANVWQREHGLAHS